MGVLSLLLSVIEHALIGIGHTLIGSRHALIGIRHALIGIGHTLIGLGHDFIGFGLDYRSIGLSGFTTRIIGTIALDALLTLADGAGNLHAPFDTGGVGALGTFIFNPTVFLSFRDSFFLLFLLRFSGITLVGLIVIVPLRALVGCVALGALVGSVALGGLGGIITLGVLVALVGIIALGGLVALVGIVTLGGLVALGTFLFNLTVFLFFRVLFFLLVLLRISGIALVGLVVIVALVGLVGSVALGALVGSVALGALVVIVALVGLVGSAALGALVGSAALGALVGSAALGALAKEFLTLGFVFGIKISIRKSCGDTIEGDSGQAKKNQNRNETKGFGAKVSSSSTSSKVRHDEELFVGNLVHFGFGI